jgi:hypothetical protein
MFRVRRKFTDGALVRVDPKRKYGKPDSEGGNGYLEEIVGTPSTPISYGVRYILSKRLSPEISPRRVHPTMGTTARKREGDTCEAPALTTHRCQPKRPRFCVNLFKRAPAVEPPPRRSNLPLDTNLLVDLAKLSSWVPQVSMTRPSTSLRSVELGRWVGYGKFMSS